MEKYTTVFLENPGKVVVITYVQSSSVFSMFFLNKQKEEAVKQFKKLNNIHEKQAFETEVYENVSHYTLTPNGQVIIN